MSKSKGFNVAWYQSRLIFGLTLIGLSTLALLFSDLSSNLFLVLGICAGGIIGLILTLYYKNNPKLQKELSINQKVFVVLSFLLIIFLDRSIFLNSQLGQYMTLMVFILAFFGSMMGVWGFLGKHLLPPQRKPA